MYVLYSALLALALLISLPYWMLQMIRHGKYREGLQERLGRVPSRLTSPAARKSIWVHAVSVGEVLAVSRLVAEIRSRLPELRVVVSTTTSTGQRLAHQRFGPENVFYFPLDFGFAVNPYLSAIQPELVVLTETEFWPNFLRLTKQKGAGIAVVNARISDRSWPRYRSLRPLFTQVLKNVDCFLAQTGTDRERLTQLGVPQERIQIAGNLKFDLAPPVQPPVVASLRSAFKQSDVSPVVVAGSTMEGEESLLLRTFEIVRGGHPRAVLILAPRHPQRFQQVTDLVASLGIPVWRRSLWSGESLAGSVLLLDTIGELAAVYALADIAFVGGSLSDHGGHNILEPAQYGVPVVIGPNYANFRQIVDLFRAHDAVRVVGPAELPLTFVDLLTNESERAALGQRALEVVRNQNGATDKTLAVLEQLLARTGMTRQSKGEPTASQKN
ncbi:MAG TPA: 3-deoxy-D-manno-octulosonic acid transferase [Terriglobales bacterium]|jgi:3-deoxy-D-manno-octulosonic-acid transferase